MHCYRRSTRWSRLRPPTPPPPLPAGRETAALRHSAWRKNKDQGYTWDGSVRIQNFQRRSRTRTTRYEPEGGFSPSDSNHSLPRSVVHHSPVRVIQPIPAVRRPPPKVVPEHPLFECAICYDSMKMASVTNCGHMFCGVCLEKWRGTRSSCPMCHATITGVFRNFEVDRVIQEQLSAEPAENPKQPCVTNNVGTNTAPVEGIGKPPVGVTLSAINLDHENVGTEPSPTNLNDTKCVVAFFTELLDDLLRESEAAVPLRKSQIIGRVQLIRELLGDIHYR